MRPVGEYMNDFMDKLKKGDFDKDYQTNNGPEINEEFGEKKVESFSKLFDMNIINKVMSGTGEI